MAPEPPPRSPGQRLLLAAALAGGLAFPGWLAFAHGSAGLVLRAGDCAGRTPVDLLLLGWLVVLVGAGAAPPVLLLVWGRWRPALHVLGIGGAGALTYLAAAFGAVALACG